MTKELPKITIVTPSYNQAQFLEETILSVLQQDYPHIEYIIIDAGSTDNSVDIIRKYEHKLAFWVSEPDRGQGHAINKGFARATGDILSWLNSDDMLTPGAIIQAVHAFQSNPDVDVVYSDFDNLDEQTGRITQHRVRQATLANLLGGGNCIPQPTAFMRRALLDRIGLVDESLYHALDWELWIRAAKHGRLLHLSGLSLAILRDHSLAKTRAQNIRRAPEFLRLLDCVYTDPTLPPEARAARRAAYARVYWIAAEAATMADQGYPAGMIWLIRSIMMYPGPTLLRPLMTLRMLGTIVKTRAKRRADPSQNETQGHHF
jgi:glycosyltransferase involved in cell wall biosynthesis